MGFCEALTEPPTRRFDKRRWNIRALVQVWSRNVDQIKPEKKQATVIADILRHAVIDVVDYDTVGTPVVGQLLFWEPKVTDERDTGEGINDSYSLALVKVDGIAQET